MAPRATSRSPSASEDSVQATHVMSSPQKPCGTGLVDEKILIEDRSCTDRFFLILFIAFAVLTAVAIVTVSQYAVNKNGEVGISFARATRLSDYEGNVCGEGVHEERGLAFFPVLPGASFNASFQSAINYRVCISSCKKTFSMTQDEAAGPNLDVLLSYLPFLDDVSGYPSRELADRVCIPDLRGLGALIPDQLEQEGEAAIQDMREAVNELLAIINTDVFGVLENWEIFPIAVGVSMFVFLVYMGLLALFGGIVIMLSAVAVGALIFAFPIWVLFGVELEYGSIEIDGFDDMKLENQEYWRYAAYVMLALGGLYTVVFLYLRKSIIAAIHILKFSTRAVMGVPTLLIFPLLWLATVVVYVVYWIVGFLILDQMRSNPQSLEVPNSVRIGNESFEIFEKSNTDVVVRNIHIFGLVWTLQFLFYFGYYVVSGTISTWYFSRDKTRIPGRTLIKQVWRATRYHIGTIAFGALLIAIVKVIRFIVKQAAKKTNSKSNKVIKALFSCAECCLKCLEAIIDRITKNGLVYTAMFGYPLMKAGMQATSLLARNLTRTAAVAVIGKYSIFIGKLFVTLGTGFAALGVSEVYPHLKGENQVLTLVAVMIVSYTVSIACFNIFDVAIDTVVLCYNYDESIEGTMYASGELKALVGNRTVQKDLHDPETGLTYDMHDMTFKKGNSVRKVKA